MVKKNERKTHLNIYKIRHTHLSLKGTSRASRKNPVMDHCSLGNTDFVHAKVE